MKVILRPQIKEQYGYVTAEIEVETYEEAIEEFTKFQEAYNARGNKPDEPKMHAISTCCDKYPKCSCPQPITNKTNNF